MTTHDLLAHVNALLADPLRVARAAALSDHRVVGHVGGGIPVALILASGAQPVRLAGAASIATPRADAILESGFTPALRAVAEQWLTGELDFLHSVVFSRADDSAQRLYYYLCELRRRGRCEGPRPLLYDLAGIARDTSVRHNRDSTRRLAEELGVRAELLDGAVRRAASREGLLSKLSAGCQQALPLAGSVAWRVRNAAAVDWTESLDAAVDQGLATLPAVATARRVVLAGDAPPDDALHLAIESGGGSVVLDLTSPLASDAGAARPDLNAIADIAQSLRAPVVAMRENAAWVAEHAHAVRADAVVFWLIEEDEALPWEIARQMRTLREAGIPALLLARQPWVLGAQAHAKVVEFVSRLEAVR